MTTEKVSDGVGCHCPEIRVMVQGADDVWVVFCECCTNSIEELPPDTKSPESVDWRCPRCKKSIIRTGMRRATKEESEAEDDEFYWRADFRCSSPTCGWSYWILLTD